MCKQSRRRAKPSNPRAESSTHQQPKWQSKNQRQWEALPTSLKVHLASQLLRRRFMQKALNLINMQRWCRRRSRAFHTRKLVCLSKQKVTSSWAKNPAFQFIVARCSNISLYIPKCATPKLRKRKRLLWASWIRKKIQTFWRKVDQNLSLQKSNVFSLSLAGRTLSWRTSCPTRRKVFRTSAWFPRRTRSKFL